MSTYFPKEGEIARKWYVIDASGQTLGRLASRVASILMGKENPKYTPFIDTGDHVVVETPHHTAQDGPAVACPAIGAMRTVKVTLASPLGTRVLLGPDTQPLAATGAAGS